MNNDTPKINTPTNDTPKSDTPKKSLHELWADIEAYLGRPLTQYNKISLYSSLASMAEDSVPPPTAPPDGPKPKP